MKRITRIVTAAILTGTLIAPAAGAAFAAGGHTAVRTVAASLPAAKTGPAARVRKAVIAARLRYRRALRHVFRVTAVNGSTISAVNVAGQPVTITVGISTTYKETGVAAPTLADVTSGESILVRGKKIGTRTFQATTVRILLARVAGVVTAVNGSTLTVTGVNATPRTVNIVSTTAITSAGVAATAADITPNTVLVAAGTLNADGSLIASRIIIRLAHVAGVVTAVNGDGTYTVRGRFGTTYTVATSVSTIYAVRQGRTLTPSTATAVTVGHRIVAFGTRSTDGKTLSARRIVIGAAVAATPAA